MKKITSLALAMIFASSVSKAQRIPNAGFENWTSMGSYNNLDSWSCLNNKTSLASIYTCAKGTPGTSGSSYLKLTSRTIGAGVVPGIAVCGILDTATNLPKSGFAYTGRPKALAGKWQHMIYGSSQGFIDVKLTRWDNNTKMRVLVASAHNVLSGMAMSWEGFSVPLVYADANAPDSCIIVLSASGTSPTNQDYLWVDELAFTGTSSVNPKIQTATDFLFFPNPSGTSISIELSSQYIQNAYLKIIDIQGRTVKTMTIESLKFDLDVNDLTKGNYQLILISQDGLLSRKFNKQ